MRCFTSGSSRTRWPVAAKMAFSTAGAATGAFVIGNDKHGIMLTLKDVGKVFKGPKWKPDDYRDLLCLLFELIRLARSNPVAVEAHIEAPESSSSPDA